MKILFNSNDGIHLTSPSDMSHNYYLLEMDGDSTKSTFIPRKIIHTKAQKMESVRDLSELLNIIDETEKEVTLISRNIDRSTIKRLKKSGVNVYITFKKNIDDAAKQYFKDRMIHELLIRQVPSRKPAGAYESILSNENYY